jgi:hypothetical protein
MPLFRRRSYITLCTLRSIWLTIQVFAHQPVFGEECVYSTTNKPTWSPDMASSPLEYKFWLLKLSPHAQSINSMVFLHSFIGQSREQTMYTLAKIGELFFHHQHLLLGPSLTGTRTIALDPTFGSLTLLESISH